MSTKEEIQLILDRGESVQFVGLAGMGKSHILREFNAIFIDASLLYPTDHRTLIINFSHSFGLKTISESSIEIQQSISQKISTGKTTIIFDGFEKIVKPEFTQFFNFLKRLRDIHKPNLNYVFSVSLLNPIDHIHNTILGDLYQVVQDNIVYAKPYSKVMFEKQIKNDFASLIDKTINYDELYRKTGGIISLVKATLKKNQLLLDSQVHEIKNQIKNASIDSLRRQGLVDKDDQIISELLRTDGNQETRLTVLETSLFNVLKENINNIVSKDKICEAVYPEVKNKNGISDSSIDQLVHRLKKKLNDYRIENKHGFGYKLVKI